MLASYSMFFLTDQVQSYSSFSLSLLVLLNLLIQSKWQTISLFAAKWPTSNMTSSSIATSGGPSWRPETYTLPRYHVCK